MLTEMSGYLAAALAGLGTWCLVQGWRYRVAGAELDRRIDTFVGATPERVRVVLERPSLGARTVVPLVAGVGKLMHGLLPDRQIDRIRATLLAAGLPSRRHLASFLAAKALLALGLGTLATMQAAGRGAPHAMLMGVIFGLLGFYLPGVWLGVRLSKRRAELTRALPDALDLLSVAVGAGLGFDGAVLEVTQRWQNSLTEELTALLRDLRLGKSRREALHALAERTGSPDIGHFVAAVLQADQLGTPLREALQVQAEQIRQRRRQRAEEAARKAAIKMMLPMGCLIFPAMLVVLMGPAIPSLRSFFQ